MEVKTEITISKEEIVEMIRNHYKVKGDIVFHFEKTKKNSNKAFEGLCQSYQFEEEVSLKEIVVTQTVIDVKIGDKEVF